MLVPRSTKYAAIDAILPGNQLVNVTINDQHSLQLYAKKDQGLARVAEALGLGTADKRITFFWVMPEDRYALASKAGNPFPVILGAHDKDSEGMVPASVGPDDTHNQGTSPAVPTKRGPGRPPKIPENPLVAEYQQRIDQYLLLLRFLPLSEGSPTPSTT